MTFDELMEANSATPEEYRACWMFWVFTRGLESVGAFFL